MLWLTAPLPVDARIAMRATVAVAVAVAVVALGGCASTPGAASSPLRSPAASPTSAQPSPIETVLPPSPSAEASPTAVVPEWRANLNPNAQTFQLRRPVALIDMNTGLAVATVPSGRLDVGYETVVGGRAFWMTDYSVSRSIANGVLKDEVTAAAVAAPSLPASLVGTEWTALPTARQVVALTFDAGGNNAGVAAIIGALQAAGAPATFFLTGRWSEVYPADARRIASSYRVGNHTYSHPDLTTLADAQVSDQVTRGEAAIESATGADPHPLFRFPHGARDARTIADVNRLGYGGIRWTVDTLGWMGVSGGQSVDSVVQRVLANLRPGEIVLMHVGAAEDGTTLDADAVPRVISEIRARGYQPVAVADFL